MSNPTFSSDFLSRLTCTKENHFNSPIEFICDFEGCHDRLACLHCLLNEHSSHFIGMNLLSKFFTRACSSSGDSKASLPRNRILFNITDFDPEESILTFNNRLVAEQREFKKELHNLGVEFSNKVKDLIQAIQFSSDSTRSKLESKVNELLESKQSLLEDPNPQISKPSPQLSTKSQLQEFLDKKFSKKSGSKKIEGKEKDYLEPLLVSKIITVNPISLNGPILQTMKNHISKGKILQFAMNSDSLEKFAFFRMKAFSPLPNNDFKKLKEDSSITTKHKKPIYKLVFYENESKFATASDDTTILLWSAISQSVIFTLTGHTDRIWNIILLGNDRLASCSSDHRVKIWNLSTQKCERTLLGHNGYVCALLELPDSGLISGSQDGRMKVWNYKTGGCSATIKGEGQGKIMTMTFLTANKLAVGSNANINVYNFKKGKVKFTLTGHTALVRDLLLMNSQDRLVSASDDHTIITWSLTNRFSLHKFTGHTLSANKLLPWNEEIIASAGDDGKVFFWNINSKIAKSEFKLAAGRSWITSITTRSDGTLITVGAEKIIKFWNV